MQEDFIYKILFWFVSAVFTVVVGGGWFFIKNWVRRIDDNFNELFASLKYLALQKDLESTEKDVRDCHDRIVKLEAKIQNCKSCNQ